MTRSRTPEAERAADRALEDGVRHISMYAFVIPSCQDLTLCMPYSYVNYLCWPAYGEWNDMRNIEKGVYMNIEKLEQAIARIRERAELVEAAAGPDAARGLRFAADELEAALNEWWHEALTPTEAEQESPWAASTIAKKLRQGELPQAGRSGAPRVRRGDLMCGTSADDPDVDNAVSEALGLVS